MDSATTEPGAAAFAWMMAIAGEIKHHGVRLGHLAYVDACRWNNAQSRVFFFFLQSWGCAPIGGINTPIG